MKLNNWKGGAILFTVLLLPSLVYVVLSSGDHKFTTSPVYGPKVTMDNGDTIYYKIHDFAITSCNGKVVYSRSLQNKIFVISFFDAKDSLGSARISGQLMTMQDRFRKNDDIVIFSIGLDNDSLSSARLCQAQADFPMHDGKWIFGTTKQIPAKLWAVQNLQMMDELGGFKANTVVLVDKKRRIRAYRDGTQYVEIKKLTEDIKVIKAEEFHPKERVTRNEGE